MVYTTRYSMPVRRSSFKLFKKGRCIMGNFKEDFHNKGQEDAASGLTKDTERHRNLGDDIFYHSSEERKEQRKSYEKGYDHNESQTSSRVICTYFYRKGMLPQKVWRADMKFTAEHLSETTVRGYHFWAIPYVKLMRESLVAERIMYPMAKWRAEELAYQMGELKCSNFKGKLVRLVVEPACWLLGCVVSQKDWNVLYATK